MLTALFLLVVLAGLGSVMVTFFGAQQQGTILDALGSRAYQAARAGIEWGAYTIANAVPGTGCAAIPSPLFTGNSLAGSLSPFSVILNCSVVVATEGGATVHVYALTATAVSGGAQGSKDHVERAISATISQLN